MSGDVHLTREVDVAEVRRMAEASRVGACVSCAQTNALTAG